ncbi:MAG: aspartate aminotransferase family protein [Proteobacteria bacterium]|nr:aspartate aminotransferase family protein [Pseudomonadota bacterium]
MDISRHAIEELFEREQAAFVTARPKSRELSERAQASLIGGVPMQWMIEWPGQFPIFLERAEGARVTDVDGHQYVDLCLGDTGAMFGHAPPVVTDEIAAQAGRGITSMLPTEDSLWVAEELARRFGLPYWQMALSATDANRFALRLARAITGRNRILVFNGCYHGTVDETIVILRDGMSSSREGNVGPAFDPTTTTDVVEFNDVEALDKVLSSREVACVLTEPALTNHYGIVLPEANYHDALRDITRRYGTLLIIDETHTISTGPGGYTRAYRLEPDMLVLGKPIASGVPAAVYGMSHQVAEKVRSRTVSPDIPVAGIGGTLSANALSTHAMRATLEHLMTEPNYVHMIALAQRLAAGVEETIRDYRLPWYVTRLGARVEYRFQPTPPRNASEAELGADPGLKHLIHLFCLNRGLLLTPFHNMALISPATSEGDVDLHTRVVRECVEAIMERDHR